jgi:segregation and condensation protein A
MAYITNYLKERKKFLFGEILKEMNERIYEVVTFMAVLDMIKNGRIIVRQNEQFGDIWIYDANEFVSVSEFIEENN